VSSNTGVVEAHRCDRSTWGRENRRRDGVTTSVKGGRWRLNNVPASRGVR
jgi:hypothetical protein